MNCKIKDIKHKNRFLAAITFVVLLCMGTSAHAQTQTVRYDVYAGGVRAVEAVMELTQDQSQYSMTFTAKTRGFLGKLVPWSGRFESHGWVMGDGSLRPQQHKSTAIWRGEVEVKDYQYTRNGGFKALVVKDHDRPSYTKEIDPVLTKGTTDALSAALGVFQKVASGGVCEGQSKVFDGKRSFTQVFAQEKWSDLQASRYNIYEGRAAECTVEVKPLAGKWHEKPRGWLSIQEQGRAKGTMPTIWVASMAENAPAVPVKVRIKTEYGTLFMHATDYKVENNTKIARK